MKMLNLFKKIFVSSYTDNKVKHINDKNVKQLKEVSRDLAQQNKTIRDVGLSIYIATGGKHGH